MASLDITFLAITKLVTEVMLFQIVMPTIIITAMIETAIIMEKEIADPVIQAMEIEEELQVAHNLSVVNTKML